MAPIYHIHLKLIMITGSYSLHQLYNELHNQIRKQFECLRKFMETQR